MALVLNLGVPVAGAGDATQTDWSGGIAATTGEEWGTTSADAAGISWLAIPGQMVLSSSILEVPVKQTIDDSFLDACSAVAGDIDGDGLMDVVGAAWEGNEIAWWRNGGGEPIQWVKHSIDNDFSGASSVHAADVDDDGDVDVLGSGWDDNEIAWWSNDGGTPVAWTKHTIATGFVNAHWVHAGDVDGDGIADALGASAAEQTIAWWRNDGQDPINWLRNDVDRDFPGARAVVTADIDGDGITDIVGAALESDEMAWWRNPGDGSGWTKQTITDDFGAAHGVQVGDLDGDGAIDVVGAGYSANRVSWWRNLGGDPVEWAEQTIGGGFWGALIADVGDLDGDNDLDVLGAAEVMSRIMLWRNDGGDPIVWTPLIVERIFRGAWPVHAADLDGDGAQDVLATADQESEVAWWKVGQFNSYGELTSTILVVPDGMLGLRGVLDAEQPPETRVSMAVRLGDDAAAMGEWFAVGPAEPFPADGATHLQYRLTLETDNPEVSPMVREVGFTWSDAADARRPRQGTGRPGFAGSP
ncbi:MAG: VCBS repeat-containing protein [bacterium]|nr:VCBS repeat-containing protein [bacterium]